MLVARILVPILGLFLIGLVAAWMVTRDRRYLQVAWRTLQTVLAIAVLLGLLYLFERVLLMA